jgi:hypothetical protein
MPEDALQHVERKYLCTAGQSDVIFAWLEHACLRDPRFPRAVVSSIYFDTPDLAFYREKQNGDYVRAKVRLRWYEDDGGGEGAAGTNGAAAPAGGGRPPGVTGCFLEVKRKDGSVSRKIRLMLPPPPVLLDGEPLGDDGISALAARAGELGCSPPGLLVPVLLVRYRRRRYVDPRSLARLSLDTGIVCTHANPAFVPGSPPAHLAVTVLEVKGGDGAFGRCLEPLAGRLSPGSFSKYAACLESLLGEGARRSRS